MLRAVPVRASRAMRWAVFTLTFLTPNLALAEAGIWVDGTIGLRRVVGSYSYEDEYSPGFGLSGPLTLEDDVNGKGLALTGTIGYAPSRYVAFGGGPSISVLSLDANRFSGASLDLALLTSFALRARFRPLGNGFFVGPSIGYARAAFAGERNDFGSADNVFETETLTGPELALNAGWADGTLGVTAELGYLHFQGDHSTYHPIFVGAALVIQHWDLSPPAAR